LWNRLFRRQYLGLNAHTENSNFRIAGVLHGLVPIVQKSRALAARSGAGLMRERDAISAVAIIGAAVVADQYRNRRARSG
jgi:ABC-type xylose transport system permease subunit